MVEKAGGGEGVLERMMVEGIVEGAGEMVANRVTGRGRIDDGRCGFQ